MQRNEFITEDNDPDLPFVLSKKSLLSWRFLAVLAFIGCILVGVFEYISPTRAVALVSFVHSIIYVETLGKTRNYWMGTS